MMLSNRLSRCAGAWCPAFMFSAAVCLLLALPAGSVSAEEVRLEIDYETGKRYLIETRQDMEMTMNIAGQKFGTTSKTTQIMVVEATPREAEGGGKVLTVSYRNIKLDSETMGQRISYDSDNPKDKNSPLAVGFAGLLNGKTVIEINQAGEVVSFSSPDGPAGNLLTEEQAQQMIGIGSNNGLPQDPVKVGATWPLSHTTDLGQVGSITINADYKLDNVSEVDGVKVADVRFDGTMTGGVTAADSPLPMTFGEGGKVSGSMKLDIEGKSMREAVFDIDCIMEISGQKMPAKIRSEQRLLSIEDL